MRRVLVVSHPAVIAENQAVYVALAELGHAVDLVVPARWTHDYVDRPVPAQIDDRLAGRVHLGRVWADGAVMRHGHAWPTPTMWLRRLRPDVVVVEEEYYSVAAAQWALACRRRGVPFGVQADENLDRPLPAIAEVLRRGVLGSAAFLMARSPDAGRLARHFTPPRPVPLRSAIVPHPLPLWTVPTARPVRPADAPTVVGYAGRLVAAKGVDDLITAVASLDRPTELRIAGGGAEQPELERLARTSPWPVTFLGPLPHADVEEFYADLDVLVLPSRTTPTWAEQFGRVLVEAAWAGVPVIGSDSGAIPWVVESLGCGTTFREGDADDLAAAIRRLALDPPVPDRARVADRFGAPATAARLAALL